MGQSTAATLIDIANFGADNGMPAAQNYPPTFNPGIAAKWALANVATDRSDYPSDPCTEFASHAMLAGGLPTDPSWYPDTDGVDRYMNSGNISGPWVNATKLVNYTVGNGWARQIPVDLSSDASAAMAKPGDLIYYTWSDGGTHLAMATGYNGLTLLMTEQTGGSPPFGQNVQWNLAHSHEDVPIAQHYKEARAYIIHWNEQPV